MYRWVSEAGYKWAFHTFKVNFHLVFDAPVFVVWLQNKSAFLCGVMKTYRQREKQGTKVLDSTKGPDEAKIKELLDRTQYTLDVTTGQRKYGGPPPESVYTGSQPTVGTEVCCSCRRPLFLQTVHITPSLSGI